VIPPNEATVSQDPLCPGKEQLKTSRDVVEQLQNKHYRHFEIDDKLSVEIFNRYLADLDPVRSYFLATDISQFEIYRYQLDDALKSGQLEPAFKIYNRYHQRVIERLAFLVKRLEQGLQNMKFEIDETLDTDRKDASWLGSRAEQDNLWLKRLKSNVLSLKLTGKSLDEITGILSRRYRNQLNRVRQTNSEDVFQLYMNALTQTYGPHTVYFSPRLSEDFDITMSLSLEGIGALLRNENEHTKVVSLIPAGPADKAGQLKPADRIVGVGQGADAETVDVVGWRIDEVVKLIRGPKGTTVRLEIIPADAEDEHQTKLISIVRNTVKLEEQSAHKKLFDLEHNGRTSKLAIIKIPTFYLDFKALRAGDYNYRSSTRDVERLLKELAETNLAGIIIDLRDNSGGSLQEAIALTGLFIRQGPIVQVRNADGSIDVLDDRDPEILYEGPLAILVNRLSASASEIFAGAIQDYRRGIIIGERTFGKGTVQALLSLNRGQLKTTVAKFYRISGESTQNNGISPDVYYPSLYDMEKIGESTLTGALPWDRIVGVKYKPHLDQNQFMDQLNKQHKIRIDQNPDYEYLLEIRQHFKKAREKTEISLHEATRRQEREENDQWRLALENKRRLAKNLKPFKKISDFESDNNTEESGDQEPGNDPLLIEAGNILIDFISLSSQIMASH